MKALRLQNDCEGSMREIERLFDQEIGRIVSSLLILESISFLSKGLRFGRSTSSAIYIWERGADSSLVAFNSIGFILR